MNTIPEDQDPTLIKISKENKDEFLVWCLTKLWEDNLKIDDEFLNYYMELKMEEWIEQYHPWFYCYTSILDELKQQQKTEKIEKEKREKEELRPTDPQKRREMFAKKFETKFNNSKFKKKKKR